MKLAITGKGGVGKTTFAGSLAKAYAADGYKVLAIDADPDANLAQALGFPDEKLEKITPLAEMKDLIANRTEAVPGIFGQMFKLNPKVDDIPQKYCIEHNGIKLLTMGTVKSGGSGCICPEHAFLRALMQHILVDSKEVLIIDMEAGIEHLGRATADSVDAFIGVVEPGKRSVQTLKTIKKLARDIGVKNVFAVGNKVIKPQDKEFIINSCSDLPVMGFLSFNIELPDVDQKGLSPYEECQSLAEEVEFIKGKIEELLN